MQMKVLAFCLIAIGASCDAQSSEHILSSDQTIRIADSKELVRGIRITTTSTSPLISQGDTITNIVNVNNAVAGQKIRIQNSNHGSGYFTDNFTAVVRKAITPVPGITFTAINAQLMEITLTAGTYKLSISQTVTSSSITETFDDAPWAVGKQLQIDWILSSPSSNGAEIDPAHSVVSRWFTYQQQPIDSKREALVAATPSDARWSLLRSAPELNRGDKVMFEIDLTNYVLAAPTSITINTDPQSTADESSITNGINAAILAAIKGDVTFDPQSSKLTFGPKATFPFTFGIATAETSGNKDLILKISDNQLGEIDVARAGVRLGTLSIPKVTPMLGVNQASGEFGVGQFNFKYVYPGRDRVQWTAAQGFRLLRIPFIFQNIQASSGSRLNEAAMRHLDPLLAECADARIICLLDLHNYGAYYQDSSNAVDLPGQKGTSNSRLADLWAQIADRYKSNSYVWFDLMNEPNRQSALEWVKTSNAIASAIRATGATNKIIFQGTAWDGAWTWASSGNAEQMLKAYDPGNNFAFEAHQYLDGNGSGTSATCVAGSGASRLDPFTTWIKKYGFHGIIGEVGWSGNEGCSAEGTALLEHWRSAIASEGSGGYIGLAYWANGPWWPDNYMYLGEPRPFPSGPEPNQLKILKNYLPR